MKKWYEYNKAELKPNSNALKAYYLVLPPLSIEQKDALIGMILGDASLQKQGKGLNSYYRIKLDLTAKNRQYAEHIAKLLEGYVLSGVVDKSRVHPSTGTEIHNVAFQTISHEAFDFFGDLFIGASGKKHVPKGLIKEHLTERGLAYWFMDDGGKTDYTDRSKDIDLHTHGFTQEDVDNMSLELNDKFGFGSWVVQNKNKSIIRISSEEFGLFYNLVDPYIHPCVRYKLPLL